MTRRFNHLPLTPPRLAALVELAKFPTGAGGIAGVMSGGLLAALVQMGLADRIDPDAVGGNRYRVNDKGHEVLASEVRS